MRVDPAELERARIRKPRDEQELVRATAFLKTPHAREILEAHPEETGSIRVMAVDDKILAALIFNPVPLMVRGVPVRCARILETAAECGRWHFRRTGDRELFDLMIEELLGYLWARRYPLCFAHGELALYAAQGFAPCFYHARVYIDVATAMKVPNPYRVRHLKSDDARRIPTLRAGNRPWKPQVFATGVPPFHHFCVESPQRELKGYFSLEMNAESTWNPKMFVPEVEATSRNAACTILHHCAAKAHKIGLKEIHFPLAPGHPFALTCLALGGRASIIAASNDPRQDEEMISPVDRTLLLRELLPGMESRLRHSSFAAGSYSVTLLTERGSWTLRCDQGTVSLHEPKKPPADGIEVEDWAFTQLVFGYRSIHEVPIKMTREARDLLHILLPKTWPYSMPDADLWDPEAQHPFPYSKKALKVVQTTKLPWVESGG